ncbi:hypothetical protein [Chromobacterium piscinae]|uniref:hypothetical protein n=1 Tax=Chromobacterium amazonense TaxID=1382803 RepID=UPI000582DD1D|nr:hypothetical protein QR66_11270 [Chromobacterium piscinae]
MIKSILRPIDEVRLDFELRAHLALHCLLSSPPALIRIIAMAYYIEIAWQGGRRAFKTPPKALVPARELIDRLLLGLEQGEMLSILSCEEWQILQGGVICADGVCQRIPPVALQNAMVAARAILVEDASGLPPRETGL